MNEADPVVHVPPDARVEGQSTPGMIREQAIASGSLWAGFVRTRAGATSAWHHHGEHESSIYVISGELRMEFGPGGAEVIEARAGDFLHVPKHAIHREGNPGAGESHLVVARAGRGPAVVNVDGPAPG